MACCKCSASKRAKRAKSPADLCSLCSQPFLRSPTPLCAFARRGFGESDADLCSFARRRFGEAWVGWTLLVCSQGHDQISEGQAGRREGVGKCEGKADAEHHDEAMDCLLKPSPPFVVGLTLGVAIARATVVTELTIKQFWAISLTGKVVAGPCMMTLPPCVFIVCWGLAHSRAGQREESPAGAIDTGMKTFQEWLAMREGLWLNDKNAVIRLSRLNPLPKNSAVNKSLAKKPKPAKPMPGVAAATPKPFKVTPPAAFKPLTV